MGIIKKGCISGQSIYWADKIPEGDENFEQAKGIITDSRKQVVAKAYYDKGNRCFMNRKYGESIECWQKVVETIPKYRDAEARLDIARVCLAREEAGIAISKAQKIVNEAASMGLDMEKAKNILSEADDLYNRAEYALAKPKAEESFQIAGYELGKKKEEVEPSPHPSPIERGGIAVVQPVEKPKPVVKRINIAVSDFEAHEVSAMEASTIADFLRTELINSQLFTVLERSHMSTILAEQHFQQTGCTTNECAVQMGKILNIEKILIGSFSKILNVYYITVRLVDVETGAAVMAETVSFSAAEELPVKIKELTAKIVDKVGKQ
ncbi:hypothetical protein HY792_06645 [Candidatus Desantisbacteria bacterium]|nr:hypothetical protein [Candidatus Desantisbacteria bacterium]